MILSMENGNAEEPSRTQQQKEPESNTTIKLWALAERHLSKEVDDSQPVFSFTNIELVLNTAVAKAQEEQANNIQGTLGSEHSG